MRSLFLISLSAAFLSGCLTSQENPNYEISSRYEGDLEARHQYADAAPVAPTVVNYEMAPTQPVAIQANTITVNDMPVAPTDTLYGSRDVSGTPGFMAMESERQAVAVSAAAEVMPEAEIVDVAPLGAAGTPIAYDIRRNLISAEAITTGQQLEESVRVVPSVGQNYIVQQGDTVYGLSRKTCVGVKVIQSMNGLSPDYAIAIGQSLTLPASVC